MIKKIVAGIRLMHPANLREHNINALLEKKHLTEAEWNMLDDMQSGRAGGGAKAVDYAEAWKRQNR